MSRVYFHTQERTVGIGGRERYMHGLLCWRLTEGMLDISPESFVRLAAEVEPGLDEDAWHDRAPTSRWSSAMQGLRERGDGLQFRPDDWASFRFRHRLSALDLGANDWRARLDAWVERS